MAFEISKQPYSGQIGETVLGTGASAVTMGGQDSYPFHVFEGKMPNAPKIAMEIWDYDPSEEWPEAAVAPFKDVLSSPEAWAKKCVDEYGADIIVLQLKSTDPNGMDRDPDEAAALAKKVSDAVDVPLVVWGTANNAKDEEVLKKISELCEGKNVALGPVEEGNHKGVGASALGYGNTIVSSSPIDVNLAKQLNILLSNLGLATSKILIDPTTGGLGYGLEYSYSVMERIQMAALTQEDEKLQMPMINNIGNEIWKAKEAGQGVDVAPTLGDPEKRGILMEATAAVSYLLAGSSVLVLRHPETVRMIRPFIELLANGGSAADIAGISKNIKAQDVDLVSLSPEMDLNFGGVEAEKKEKPKKEAAPKKEPKKKAAPKKEDKKAAPKKEEKKKEPKADKTEEEVKAAAKADAKVKAEAAAKAEADAKAKAEADAKAKAEAEKKAGADAKAKADAEEEELRQKRAAERENLDAQRAKGEAKDIKITPSAVQMTEQEKILDRLNRIHRRTPLN
ncbi:MAG: acetyl-CoA decarbonylase/synthase complex subunit delta [Deltaproteobacteria bacterium]|nr:acetyl-CoA decarbonylase/synthase complex subunit delta [Deltaproteobacteria bacterium]